MCPFLWKTLHHAKLGAGNLTKEMWQFTWCHLFSEYQSRQGGSKAADLDVKVNESAKVPFYLFVLCILLFSCWLSVSLWCVTFQKFRSIQKPCKRTKSNFWCTFCFTVVSISLLHLLLPWFELIIFFVTLLCLYVYVLCAFVSLCQFVFVTSGF